MIDFDCHAHIYEHITAVANARYVPSSPAPLSKWHRHLDQNGLKGGVIVQVSFLGNDNSQLCAALAELDRAYFAGVAVVPFDVSEAELERLVLAGVRGIRWNLVRGAQVPDFATKLVQDFLRKLRQYGLHIEIHLEGPRLGRVLPQLTDQGIKIVVDHFGLPSDPNPRQDPFVRAVAQLPDISSLYFKFSAHYRTAFDLHPHAKELLMRIPQDNVVWGSDWPHTQHEQNANFAAVATLRQGWELQSDQAATHALYGLSLR